MCYYTETHLSFVVSITLMKVINGRILRLKLHAFLSLSAKTIAASQMDYGIMYVYLIIWLSLYFRAWAVLLSIAIQNIKMIFEYIDFKIFLDWSISDLSSHIQHWQCRIKYIPACFNHIFGSLGCFKSSDYKVLWFLNHSLPRPNKLLSSDFWVNILQI